MIRSCTHSMPWHATALLVGALQVPCFFGNSMEVLCTQPAGPLASCESMSFSGMSCGSCGRAAPRYRRLHDKLLGPMHVYYVAIPLHDRGTSGSGQRNSWTPTTKTSPRISWTRKKTCASGSPGSLAGLTAGSALVLQLRVALPPLLSPPHGFGRLCR